MEYLSIKDFASRAGVSPQAIYQRLDKDLKSYVKVVDKKKTLSIKALELFEDKQVGQDVTKSFQEVLSVLSNQLLEKDKQIAFLQEQLQAAQALHAGTIQKQLTDGQAAPTVEAATPEEKPGFFQRIFGKKKSGD